MQIKFRLWAITFGEIAVLTSHLLDYVA